MTMDISKGVRMGALGLGAAAALLILGVSQVGAETESKPAAAKRACIDVDRAASRRVVGPNQLLIQDGFGRSALLTLSAPCSNMDELDTIGFETYTSSLCDKRDMKILHSRNGEAPLTCLITSLKLMDKVETKGFEDNEKAADAKAKAS